MGVKKGKGLGLWLVTLVESSAATCMGRPGGQGGRRARQAGWGDDGFGLKDLSLNSLWTQTRRHRVAIGYVFQGRDARDGERGSETMHQERA